MGIAWVWTLVAGVAIIGCWMLIDPRSAWRVLAAWQYRHPERNEPSEGAYRLIGGIQLIAAFATTAMLAAAPDGPVDPDVTPSEQTEGPDEYQLCLEEYADTFLHDRREAICEAYEP